MAPNRPQDLRARLAAGMRIASAVFVLVFFIAAMVVCYRLADHQNLAFVGGPDWIYPLVVIGVVAIGGVGLCVDAVERRGSPYPWLLVALGTVIQLALVLSDMKVYTVRTVAPEVLPPLAAVLAIVEFSRELRSLLDLADGTAAKDQNQDQNQDPDGSDVARVFGHPLFRDVK